MILIVTGGRKYADGRAVADAIPAVFAKYRTHDAEALNVWHGDAPGADRLAKWWAAANDHVQLPFPAEWETYGRGAGPKRNERMVSLAASHMRNGHTVVCLAFPGGKGTADCVERARRHGIPVVQYTPTPKTGGAA